jgi:hypothetical protein
MTLSSSSISVSLDNRAFAPGLPIAREAQARNFAAS